MAAFDEVKKTVSVDLGTLLDAGDGAVVTLVAGDTRLAAHRAVLAAKSPVFAAMFSHDMLEATSGEVNIADMNGPVLRQLVAYMYTCTPPQLPDIAPQLLAAADKYGLSALKAACEKQVTAQMTVENAAAAAVLAVKHSCPKLTDVAIGFIKANLIDVMATDGWAHAVHTEPVHVVEVSRLLREPPAEIRNLSLEEKSKRLVIAADDGRAEEVRTLLAAGADVGARPENTDTALHRAAFRGHLEVASSLLAAGAEVDATNEVQCTALHRAAHKGHTAVVRLLLASSADVNRKGNKGKTSLHFAAEYGHREVAAVLLEARANKDIKDNSGRTSLDLARENKQQQIIDLLT